MSHIWSIQQGWLTDLKLQNFASLQVNAKPFYNAAQSSQRQDFACFRVGKHLGNSRVRSGLLLLWLKTGKEDTGYDGLCQAADGPGNNHAGRNGKGAVGYDHAGKRHDSVVKSKGQAAPYKEIALDQCFTNVPHPDQDQGGNERCQPV
jgi:hypothetical protein